jgi:hypothetical protein
MYKTVFPFFARATSAIHVFCHLGLYIATSSFHGGPHTRIVSNIPFQVLELMTAGSTLLQPLTFVCMSTVDDLSYTPSPEERTRDAAQIAATGRRSWKTLKGKGEAVWPPLLEAALIEGMFLSSLIAEGGSKFFVSSS